MIFPHIVFLSSFFCYLYFYLKNINYIIYPLYLFLPVIYCFLIVFSYLDKINNKHKFLDSFKDYQKNLYVFILFVLTPFFIRLNLPDPHNFIQRKLEIMLGAVYITFIVVCTIKLFLKFYLQQELTDENKLFKNIVIYFFVFYFAVSLWFNYANQPTGDEPEYLLMAHSLVYDRDIDLKNNFEKKDYQIFYKNKELKPQDAAVKKDNKLYSYHPFMISLLISPFYLIGKRLGATIFLNFLAALLSGIIFLLSNKIYKDIKLGILISIISGFSMPLLIHINHVATDVTSGLFLTFSYYILFFLPQQYILFSTTLALSIWLHLRNIPVAFIIFLLFVFFNRKQNKIILTVIFLQLMNIIILLFVNKMIYGDLLPKHADAGNNFLGGFNFNIIKGFSGIFFDQEFGLFFYIPVFFLLPAGFFFLYKIRRDIFYSLIFIFVPFLLFISSWGEWRGGGGASARFFIPIIFCLCIPIGAIFYYCKDKKNYLLKILTGMGFILSYIMLLVPWFRWNKGEGYNWILKIISSFINIDIYKFFPSIWCFHEYTIFSLFFWGIFFVFINFYIIFNTLTIKKNNIK